MRQKFLDWLKAEDGATAIEYALIGALVSVAIVGSLGGFSTAFQASYSKITANLWGGN